MVRDPAASTARPDGGQLRRRLGPLGPAEDRTRPAWRCSTAGFSESDVDKVLWRNPVEFYGQSDRLVLDELPGFARSPDTFAGNSVLRGGGVSELAPDGTDVRCLLHQRAPRRGPRRGAGAARPLRRAGAPAGRRRRARPRPVAARAARRRARRRRRPRRNGCAPSSTRAGWRCTRSTPSRTAASTTRSSSTRSTIPVDRPAPARVHRGLSRSCSPTCCPTRRATAASRRCRSPGARRGTTPTTPRRPHALAELDRDAGRHGAGERAAHPARRRARAGLRARHGRRRGRPGSRRRVDPRYVGLCLDTCHLAVSLRRPGRDDRGASTTPGLSVVKVQASAALQVDEPGGEPARLALADFAEPRYLHQVRERTADGGVLGADDIPQALAELPARARRGGCTSTCRCTPGRRRRCRRPRDVLRAAIAALGRRWTASCRTSRWRPTPGACCRETAGDGGDTALIRGIAAELRWAAAAAARLGQECA